MRKTDSQWNIYIQKNRYIHVYNINQDYTGDSTLIERKIERKDRGIEDIDNGLDINMYVVKTTLNRQYEL